MKPKRIKLDVFVEHRTGPDVPFFVERKELSIEIPESGRSTDALSDLLRSVNESKFAAFVTDDGTILCFVRTDRIVEIRTRG